jgi:Protein of unknown function (DUF551)
MKRLWQPIETAPTDQTRILGWNGHEVSVMSYERHGAWTWEADWDYGGYGTEYDYRSSALASVTHWMPLPDQPP